MALVYDWDVPVANRGTVAKTRLTAKAGGLLTTTVNGPYDANTALEAIAAEAAAFMTGATPMVQGSAVTAVGTTAASDITSAVTLVNNLKTAVNTLISRATAAGMLAS